MRIGQQTAVKLLYILGIGLLVLPSFGCIGFTSHMMYWVFGDEKVPADWDGLRGKRVAIVCVSDSSPYGPDEATEMLGQLVATELRQNVKNIKVIHQGEVANWIDNHDWEQLDFIQIGRGVDAEAVLAVELSSYSLHDGKTLYKGRANIKVTVYDVAGKQIVYRKNFPDFEFPRDSGLPVISTTERRFEQNFIAVVGRQVAHLFYAYPMKYDLAHDATAIHRE